MVVVEDGKSGKYLTTIYNGFVVYNPELLTRDFTSDQIDDVMVTANSGGSSGIYHHLIATFKDGEADKISEIESIWIYKNQQWVLKTVEL